MIKSEKCAQGFTLIELKGAVALLSLTLVMGFPLFSNQNDSNKLRTIKNLLVSDFNRALQRVSSKNFPVALCFANISSQCGRVII